MGPFCSEQGNSSHETIKDLASTNEKTMFSGEDVGSEKEISKWSYQIHTTLEEMLNSYKLLIIVYSSTKNVGVVPPVCFLQDKY